jgi:hypothetical protein
MPAWQRELLAEGLRIEEPRFQALEQIAGALGGRTRIEKIPTPADCVDGFIEAFWNRPEALLDPAARCGSSCPSLPEGFRRQAGSASQASGCPSTPACCIASRSLSDDRNARAASSVSKSWVTVMSLPSSTGHTRRRGDARKREPSGSPLVVGASGRADATASVGSVARRTGQTSHDTVHRGGGMGAARTGGNVGGISIGGILVIVGIVLAIVWSFWVGLIVAVVGLVAFGGFAKGKWY